MTEKHYIFISHNKIAQDRFIKPYSEYIRTKPGVGVSQLCVENFGIISAFFKVFAQLKKHDKDGTKTFVITQHPMLMLFFTLRYVSPKTIFLHFVTGQVWVTKPLLKRLVLKYIDFKFLQLADKIWPDSIAQYDFLLEQGYPSPNLLKPTVGSMGGLSVIPECYFTANAPPKNLAWIGRSTPDKNFKQFLALAHEAENKYPLLRFHVFGANFTLATCKPSNVIIHGFQSDLKQALRDHQVELLICTSLREGFNLSILECAAMGIPCLSTNIYGTSDVITATGMTRFTFHPHSLKSAYCKLNLYMSLPQNERVEIQKICVAGAAEYKRSNVVKAFWSNVNED